MSACLLSCSRCVLVHSGPKDGVGAPEAVAACEKEHTCPPPINIKGVIDGYKLHPRVVMSCTGTPLAKKSKNYRQKVAYPGVVFLRTPFLLHTVVCACVERAGFTCVRYTTMCVDTPCIDETTADPHMHLLRVPRVAHWPPGAACTP